jgi:hypothetical protein
MDVDKRSIDWCRQHISRRNPRFSFYRVDLHSEFYNPGGSELSETYAFPHEAGTMDLIILISVFTHLLEGSVRNFSREIARMLKPDGAAYATFFTYNSREEAVGPTATRSYVFPHFKGRYALANETFPEAAVAYQEDHLRRLLGECGLVVAAVEQMLQTVIVMKKAHSG